MMLSCCQSLLPASASYPLPSNKENGAICIRHQTTSKSTRCLPSTVVSLLRAVALRFSIFIPPPRHTPSVCRRRLMPAIGVCFYQADVVSVEQANQPASLSTASGSSPLRIATLYVTCHSAVSRGFRRRVLTRQMAARFARQRAFFFLYQPCSVCSHPWIARNHPCFFTPRSDIRFPNSLQRPSSLKPTIKVMRTEATRA